MSFDGLTDGLIKHAAGVPAQAVPGTDYAVPLFKASHKLSAAAQRLQLLAASGVNGNTHKGYRLTAHLRFATATGICRLRFNESVTALEYAHLFQDHDAGVASGPSTSVFTGFTNSPGIGSVYNVELVWLELRTGGLVRVGHFEGAFDLTVDNTDVRRTIGAIRWNDTVTNLTAVEIESDVAGCFDAGSWLQLEQLNVPT